MSSSEDSHHSICNHLQTQSTWRASDTLYSLIRHTSFHNVAYDPTLNADPVSVRLAFDIAARCVEAAVRKANLADGENALGDTSESHMPVLVDVVDQIVRGKDKALEQCAWPDTVGASRATMASVAPLAVSATALVPQTVKMIKAPGAPGANKKRLKDSTTGSVSFTTAHGIKPNKLMESRLINSLLIVCFAVKNCYEQLYSQGSNENKFDQIALPYNVDDVEQMKNLRDQSDSLVERVMAYVRRLNKTERDRHELKKQCLLQEKMLVSVTSPTSSTALNDLEIANIYGPKFETNDINGIPKQIPSDATLEVMKNNLMNGLNMVYLDCSADRVRSMADLFSFMREHSYDGHHLILTSSADLPLWSNGTFRNTTLVTYTSFCTDVDKYISSEYTYCVMDRGCELLNIQSIDPNGKIGKLSKFLFKLIKASNFICIGQSFQLVKPSVSLSFFTPELYDMLVESLEGCKYFSDGKSVKFVEGVIQSSTAIISKNDGGTATERLDGWNRQNDLELLRVFTASKLRNALEGISLSLLNDFVSYNSGDSFLENPSAGLVRLEEALAKLESRQSLEGYPCREISSSFTNCSFAAICNRRFATETALRQHRTSMHAPPGTWLCRSCGDDCITSVARTSHERHCGAATDEGSKSEENGSEKQVGPGVGKRSNKKSESSSNAGNTDSSKGNVDLLSGGTSSIIPALSIINIKDLPPYIKPLLRDPRQQIRASGHSKRHVYAYRGVCRQARKGHDRWQSQISYGGTNHYLGTFNSEWDAAAVYAWAHWILYGEEATKQAQKEGEEAAAEWEKEKKLIAEGKMVIEDVKKKKTYKRKTEGATEAKPPVPKSKPGRKRKDTLPKISEKKGSARRGASNPNYAAKIPLLSEFAGIVDMNDDELLQSVVSRIQATRKRRKRELEHNQTEDKQVMTICYPVKDFKPPNSLGQGFCMLVGLSCVPFQWSLEDFITRNFPRQPPSDISMQALEKEFRGQNQSGGLNATFRVIVRGSPCILGRVSSQLEEASQRLGLGDVEIGSFSGDTDCHVGGPFLSCSPQAAVLDVQGGQTSISCISADDIISVNGRILDRGNMIVLKHGDVCTVGARVFMICIYK